MSTTEHIEKFDPLQQFVVSNIIDLQVAGFNVSFTNSSLFMVLSVLGVIVFISGGMRHRSLVPGRWQSMAELSYEFVAGTIKDNVGNEGRAFFPFIFSIFMFILFANLVGMLPYSFTVTSHIIVTFALALTIFIGVTIVGFMKQGVGYLKMFCPTGTPVYLMPLLIPIEIFSYFTRPLTLAIRLGANMIAGHILLKVLANFVILMGVFGVFPLLFMTVMVGFEIFVAFLQAYIFTVLACVYLSDAIHAH